MSRTDNWCSFWFAFLWCSGFVVDAIGGYIKTASYSIAAMEEREAHIRDTAVDEVTKHLSRPQLLLFNWVLAHARRGEPHRGAC